MFLLIWNAKGFAKYVSCKKKIIRNKYVGSPYRLAELYAGRVACCPLVSHGEYADGTGRRTDRRMDAITLRYITLISTLHYIKELSER